MNSATGALQTNDPPQTNSIAPNVIALTHTHARARAIERRRKKGDGGIDRGANKKKRANLALEAAVVLVDMIGKHDLLVHTAVGLDEFVEQKVVLEPEVVAVEVALQRVAPPLLPPAHQLHLSPDRKKGVCVCVCVCGCGWMCM